MLRHVRWVSAVMTLGSSFLFAQGLEQDWLSFGRVSFSFSSSYHFNAWKNYNNTLATVTRRIRLDSFFFEPTGLYEQIKGDVTIKGAIGYEIVERLRIQFTGQYGQLGSRFEFYPDSNKLARAIESVTFHQNLSFDIRSFGFEAVYSYPIANDVELTSTLGVDRFTGRVKIDWRHLRSWRGPLAEDQGEGISSDLKANTWGWNASFAFTWNVIGPISLTAGVQYRNAKLKNLEGPAVYRTPVYTFGGRQEARFTAELVEASNYFGVRVKEQNPSFYVSLPPLTFLTEPGPEVRIPASINLTSFGIRGGLKVQF